MEFRLVDFMLNMYIVGQDWFANIVVDGWNKFGSHVIRIWL